MNGKLYTIGYAGLSAAELTDVLKSHNIDTVLDVRSVPKSSYAPQFDRESITGALDTAGIAYAFMGQCFGARPREPWLYGRDGRADFLKIAGSKMFLAGLDNVFKGLAEGHRVALMCAEKDPLDCHRAILVARALSTCGVQAVHILRGGAVRTQAELDDMLLQKYFPEGAQLSFAGCGVSQGREEQLKEAYRLRGREIAHVRDAGARAV